MNAQDNAKSGDGRGRRALGDYTRFIRVGAGTRKFASATAEGRLELPYAVVMASANNLVLMGGGDTDSLHASLTEMIARADTSKPLLFLPHAAPIEMHQQYFHDHFRAWLEPHGWPADRATHWSVLDPLPGTLDDFAGIFIAGGNTFALWHTLRNTPMHAALARYTADGGLVAGNSAGALIMGADFRYAHDPNDVGLRDTRGYDVLGGYAFWAHYAPDPHDAEIAEFIAHTGHTVVALPNYAGVAISGTDMKALGDEVFVFTGSTRQAHRPGETWTVG